MFGIFDVHLLYFMEILVYLVGTWYIIPILVCCSKKDLATLLKILSGVALSEAIKVFFSVIRAKGINFKTNVGVKL
jgi:hypothetical protein